MLNFVAHFREKLLRGNGAGYSVRQLLPQKHGVAANIVARGFEHLSSLSCYLFILYTAKAANGGKVKAKARGAYAVKLGYSTYYVFFKLSIADALDKAVEEFGCCKIGIKAARGAWVTV